MDVDVLRAWVEHAVTDLGRHRTRLDEANVFPVADSDTGTNLYLTLLEARRRVRALADDAPADLVATAAARGVLVGARGNSGVIVGQYLGALWRALPAGPRAPIATALTIAAEAATAAVATPVPGTVLTVADRVAQAAVDRSRHGPASGGPGLTGRDLDVLEVALDAGWEAAGRTPEQLDALRLAGVVDAGAVGLLVVLEALLRAAGRPREREITLTSAPHHLQGLDGEGQELQGYGAVGSQHQEGACAHAPDDGEFEVMALLHDDGDTAPGAREQLRDGLVSVGVSVAVVSQSGLCQTHVHTDHPVAAVAAVRAVGARGLVTDHVVVRDLARQSGVHSERHRPALGLVAVTRATGLAPDLARAGAVVVVIPDDRDVSATGARAGADTGAGQVLVLVAAGTVEEEPILPEVQVHLMVGLDELGLVAAVRRLLECVGEAVGSDELVALARDAAAQVRGRHLEDVAAVDGAVEQLLVGSDDVLTVVTRHDTPPILTEAIGTAARRAHPGVEVLVLHGGAPGAGASVGVG